MRGIAAAVSLAIAAAMALPACELLRSMPDGQARDQARRELLQAQRRTQLADAVREQAECRALVIEHGPEHWRTRACLDQLARSERDLLRELASIDHALGALR